MKVDPGLPRRFPRSLHLEDYSPAELARICAKVAAERFKVELDDGVETLLRKHFKQFSQHELSSQNGGLAVNTVEKAMARLAARAVSEGTVASEKTLRACDFGLS